METTSTRSIIMLLGVAGLPLTMLAQQNTPTQQAERARQEETRKSGSTRGQTEEGARARSGEAGSMNSASNFRTWSWLDDRDIYSSNGTKIGEFNDLIIERGSGRITHVVVESGGAIGVGSQSTAIPYGALRWDASKEHFTMSGTAESVRQLPRFSPGDWNALRESTPLASSSWYTQSDHGARENNRRGERGERGMRGDEGGRAGETRQNQDRTDNAARNETQPDNGARSDGTTTRANESNRDDRMENRRTEGGYRDQRPTGNGQTPALNDWIWDQSARSRTSEPYGSQWDAGAKQTIEGEVKRVHRTDLPNQGEQVIVEVALADGSTKKVSLGPSWYVGGGETMLNRGDRVSIEVIPLHIATSASVNGREIKLRESDGTAAWSKPSYETGGKSYSAPYYQNMLASTLKDAKLDCRGNECGKVDEIIFEIESGEVAFLSIDPNQNFLGIADTKRLVPWSVATVSMDGTVRLDASKEMVVGSVETPSDLKSLTTGGADSVYRSYQVDQRTFTRREGETTWNDGWNR